MAGKPQRQRNQVDYSPQGHQRVRHDLATKRQQRTVLLFFFSFLLFICWVKKVIICPGVLSTFWFCWWHLHSVFLTSASKLVVRLKHLETCSCLRLRYFGKNTSENGVCLPITSHQEVNNDYFLTFYSKINSRSPWPIHWNLIILGTSMTRVLSRNFQLWLWI